MANGGLFLTPQQALAAEQQMRQAQAIQQGYTPLGASAQELGRSITGAFGRAFGVQPQESASVQLARSRSEAVKTINPEKPETFLDAARNLYASGDYQGATELYSNYLPYLEIAAKQRAEKDKITSEDAKQKFQDENTLRDEYQAQSKFYNKAVQGYDTIKASVDKPDAVGDLSLIFAFMKTLDPESVVREGEFATAEKTAGALGWFKNIWSKVQNGERLTEPQRRMFSNRASKLMRSHETRQNQLRGQYKSLAERNALNPTNVVVGISTNPTEKKGPVFTRQERDWIDRALADPRNQGATEEDVINWGIEHGKIKSQ